VSDGQPRERLTAREYEVLSAVNVGLSNQAIARRLNITPATVRTHLGKLFNKLGVSSRLELAVFARHHRIVESSEISGLGFSVTDEQRNLILRALHGQLREEDVEPARRLADVIALRREKDIRKTVA
jgi:DNA-binding CsgD family transcriptional regulator